jgi:hypothetical protein
MHGQDTHFVHMHEEAPLLQPCSIINIEADEKCACFVILYVSESQECLVHCAEYKAKSFEPPENFRMTLAHAASTADSWQVPVTLFAPGNAATQSSKGPAIACLTPATSEINEQWILL